MAIKLLGLTAVTVITLFYVWTRLQNIRLNREVKTLQAVEREVNLQNGKLRIKWAKLSAPLVLKSMGEKKFELFPPKPSQVIFISEPEVQHKLK